MSSITVKEEKHEVVDFLNGINFKEGNSLLRLVKPYTRYTVQLVSGYADGQQHSFGAVAEMLRTSKEVVNKECDHALAVMRDRG